MGLLHAPWGSDPTRAHPLWGGVGVDRVWGRAEILECEWNGPDLTAFRWFTKSIKVYVRLGEGLVQIPLD